MEKPRSSHLLFLIGKVDVPRGTPYRATGISSIRVVLAGLFCDRLVSKVVAGDRFPGEHTKQRVFVAERKEEVAARIERGERIAGVEVNAKQVQQVRDMTQEVIYEKSRSFGGR